MKKILIGAGALLGGGAIAVSIMAARFVPTIRPNTVIGMVPVGGLTKEEAAKKVRIWWEAEKGKTLTIKSSLIVKELPPMTPGQLGITVDDEASVAQAELSDFWETAQQRVSGPLPRVTLPIKYKSTGGASLEALSKRIKDAIGGPKPAKIEYVGGQIKRTPEVTSFTLDEEKLSDAVTAGLSGDGTVQVPVKEAPKHIPDEELNKISDVMSSYSTTFPSYQTSRNTNIRLASAKLSGRILMPGETISFNQTVGKRTVEGGFREAPVLANGKHDRGIGGGICQVSTTLYNSALLADLKIVQRQNHSVPSVYVPCGRDATVDWPDLDLKFQNNQPGPIAIVSTYENGKITFRILGQKVPGKEVKIVTSGLRSWGRGERRYYDPSLPAGAERVIEHGSSGRSINVYRVVYVNGAEVRRDFLGESNYSGMERQVAYGPARSAPSKPAPSPSNSPAPTPEPAPANPTPTDTPPPSPG